MSNQWFRMYHEFATDPKIQMLSESDQRRFIMVLCLRCSNDDVTLHDEEVAFQLRISDEEWLKTKEIFLAKKMIDENNQPTNWNKRQFKSDTSNDRVKAYRKRKKAVEDAKKKAQENTGNDNVTLQKRDVNALDTDTDTDTDTDKTHRCKKSDSEENPKITKAQLKKLHPEIEPNLIDEWWIVRKDKKANSLTKTAWENFTREAGKASLTLNDTMKICVKNHWRGFEASWLINQQSSAKPGGAGNVSNHNQHVLQEWLDSGEPH